MVTFLVKWEKNIESSNTVKFRLSHFSKLFQFQGS